MGGFLAGLSGGGSADDDTADLTPFGQTGSASGGPGQGPMIPTAAPPSMPDMTPAASTDDPRPMTPTVGPVPSAADINSAASPVHHAVSLLGPNHPVSKFLTGMGSLMLHQNQLPGGMNHAQAMGAAMGPAMTPTSTGQPAQAMPGDPAKQTLLGHISAMSGALGNTLMGGSGV